MKKPTIEPDFFYRLLAISKLKPENVQDKLVEFISGIKPRSIRTSLQNRALHKDCDLIAEKLNEAGIEKHAFFKQGYFIPWTMESVKNDIFKQVMKAMYNKESTTELDKNGGEIEKIHEVIMRELAEKHGIEYHEFPHDPDKKKELEKMMIPEASEREERESNYPTGEVEEPTF